MSVCAERRLVRALLSVALVTSTCLAACGGGGGGDERESLPPPPPRSADAWERVDPSNVARVCQLDPDLLVQADREIERACAARPELPCSYAVVRHGELCHEYYAPGSSGIDGQSETFSATKTFGALITGIAAYETRDLPRSGRKTGPLSDTDRVDHWLDDFSFHRDATVAHVLAMVAHNAALEHGSKSYSYDCFGSIQIDRLKDVVHAAIAQDPERLGRDLEELTRRFLFEPLGMEHSQWSAGNVEKSFAVSWSASLRDMARLGLLLLRGGVWNGRRILAEEWVYRMTHPAFEDANTGYGYLTWLNSASNWTEDTFPPCTDDAPGKIQGPVDTCSPVALHRSYPHPPSGAPDCGYAAPYRCDQAHDVGVWWAEGAYGQLIVGHPGLDLLLVAKNIPNEIRPTGVWDAVRPALVALDPVFRGDQEAFCTAYSRNEYAPDLRSDAPPAADAIVEELAETGHVLWIGAHPDDEVAQAALLGEIGAERGVKLTFLLATRGEATTNCFLPGGCRPDLATVRAGEMAASALALQGGGADIVQLGLPDGPAGFASTVDPRNTLRAWEAAAGGREPLVARFRAAIESISPGAVILQDPRHGGTCHPDHRATAALVVEALRAMGADSPPAYLSETVRPDGIHFEAAEPSDPSLIRYDARRFGPAIEGETWSYTIRAAEAHGSQFPSEVANLLAGAPAENRANFLVRLAGAWPSEGYEGYDDRCPIRFGYDPAGEVE